MQPVNQLEAVRSPGVTPLRSRSDQSSASGSTRAREHDGDHGSNVDRVPCPPNERRLHGLESLGRTHRHPSDPSGPPVTRRGLSSAGWRSPPPGRTGRRTRPGWRRGPPRLGPLHRRAGGGPWWRSVGDDAAACPSSAATRSVEETHKWVIAPITTGGRRPAASRTSARFVPVNAKGAVFSTTPPRAAGRGLRRTPAGRRTVEQLPRGPRWATWTSGHPLPARE